MTETENDQIQATVNAWRRLRGTPIVDDDFPEMMERFELEMARLEATGRTGKGEA